MNNSIVTIDPDIQSGIPVFTGTRVPIKSFFDYISTGESIETYLQDYPYVNKEQIYSLIAFLGNWFEKSTHTFLNENPA
ncbi:MAG: hypothetical protein A2309_01715 [Bacteroidetes bacterium RIFOXYB2_FULL_35_7]|nr:MAG: hypothetical protein A2X01_13025 [Bacteroidetes bacterium GWF2_35_48]OFY92464.1 MAG: hypothetical protein A2309_01715 [Bacteroidetes bacterium RIFOXYB2_FULL_35_7]OFY95319.1 MAG: hypothetical protein A2491_21715 [Bacteroidetes bacterium RIFOXYC12_FULL_35_7]HBX53711.1 hypothetical protein [Bacteroidales bacterium]